MNVHELNEQQTAAFREFADMPAGAWMLEALVVGNYVLDPIPSVVMENDITRPLTEHERGVCEGRRQIVLEIMDVLQVGVQGAYEVINRVDRMARADADSDNFAES